VPTNRCPTAIRAVFEGVSCIPFPGGSETSQSWRPTSGLPRSRYPFYLGPESRLIDLAVGKLIRQYTAPLTQKNVPYQRTLFYGPPGTGKSHLLWGISRLITPHLGHRRQLILTTGNDFARELINAIETRSTDQFQRRYRSARLVLIDDLLQMESKEAAQKELITTIDAIEEAGNQLVATAPYPPGEWINLLPALQSRLADGLMVPTPKPTEGVRAMILAQEAHQRGLPLEMPVVRLLAARLEGTARDLQGAVNRLAMIARLEASPIDEKLANKFLDSEGGVQKMTLLEIANASGRRFGISLAQLRSSARHRQIVIARGVAIYLARQLVADSFESIGHFFGGRDHTTIMHAFRKIEKAITEDPDLNEMVGLVREDARRAVQGEKLPKRSTKGRGATKRRGPYG
jgi:chromosomal replication initiator protein